MLFLQLRFNLINIQANFGSQMLTLSIYIEANLRRIWLYHCTKDEHIRQIKYSMIRRNFPSDFELSLFGHRFFLGYFFCPGHFIHSRH